MDNLLCINAMCVRFHGLVHGVKIVSITVNWFEAFCGLKVGSWEYTAVQPAADPVSCFGCIQGRYNPRMIPTIDDRLQLSRRILEAHEEAAKPQAKENNSGC